MACGSSTLFALMALMVLFLVSASYKKRKARAPVVAAAASVKAHVAQVVSSIVVGQPIPTVYPVDPPPPYYPTAPPGTYPSVDVGIPTVYPGDPPPPYYPYPSVDVGSQGGFAPGFDDDGPLVGPPGEFEVGPMGDLIREVSGPQSGPYQAAEWTRKILNIEAPP
jgi:hypothetical protein